MADHRSVGFEFGVREFSATDCDLLALPITQIRKQFPAALQRPDAPYSHLWTGSGVCCGNEVVVVAVPFVDLCEGTQPDMRVNVYGIFYILLEEPAMIERIKTFGKLKLTSAVRLERQSGWVQDRDSSGQRATGSCKATISSPQQPLHSLLVTSVLAS